MIFITYFRSRTDHHVEPQFLCASLDVHAHASFSILFLGFLVMVNANKPLDAAVDLAVAVIYCVFNHWRVGTTLNFTNIQCGAP